jgi:hypothetical protein
MGHIVYSDLKGIVLIVVARIVVNLMSVVAPMSSRVPRED